MIFAIEQYDPAFDYCFPNLIRQKFNSTIFIGDSWCFCSCDILCMLNRNIYRHI